MPSVKKSQKVSVKEVVSEPEIIEEPKVADPEPEVKPETDTEAEVEIQEPISDQIKNIIMTVDSHIKNLKDTKIQLKNLLVSYQKEVKDSKNKKKRKNLTNKEYVPHGFTKPVHISPELSEFLKVDKETLVARPSVTKAIAAYVRENNLADEKDGSIFSADKVLKKVLGEARFLIKSKKPELGMGYSFGSLQKYLVPHFQKQ